MNFNIDDPLADLLSDNSFENDSFFDNPNASGASKKSSTKAKGKMEDLFGIKEETEPLYKTSFQRKQTSNPSNPPVATSTPRITKQQPSQAKDEDDDDDLGFDPKKPKAGAKLNLLDDLLRNIEPKRPATAAAATTTTTTRREETPNKGIMSRQSTDTTTENSNFLGSQIRPKTSTGRRSSGTSAVVNIDPLGLFSAREPPVSTSGMSTPKLRKRGTTADWLGLSGAAEPEEVPNKHEERRPETPKSPTKLAKSPPKPYSTLSGQSNVDILQISAEAHTPAEPILETSRHTPKQWTTDISTQSILHLNNINMGAKNTLTVLQQQESQLSLAMQMKSQESALLEMQHKQDTLLQQQEQQFQALLQQQLLRQHQMEEHVKQQQQRINAHIELMMTQPAMMVTLPQTDTTEVSGKGDAKHTAEAPTLGTLELVKMEADVKRLELEKLRLEELVENMKSNYEREIELIENSYKKQLKVLEEHLVAVETRLKSDIEELSRYYGKKLDTLEQEKQKLKIEHENENAALKQDHEDELRKLKKSQEDDFEMLKEEHRRMLESIRQAKMLEFAAVQENGSYLETLRVASSNLENLSGGLQGLRDDMQLKIETLNKEREQKLLARERKIEDAERRLKLTEETADDEKRRLMELVATLELQLNKLSKDNAEDNWQLRQKLASLESEKAAFEREKEYVREQLMRDEKRIEDLKTQQLVETQRTLLELQEERERLVVQRTKIETERKLHPHTALERERLEIDATLKVAQDATRQADIERERYHKLQRQLEQQKRELVDKENILRAKEDELELEVNSFRLAERKSQAAQQKAQMAERNFQTKIQFLQQRMRELGEKEANLSQERMLLTQERIKLHNLKVKLGERKCALCKMSEQSEEITHLLNAAGVGGEDEDVPVATVMSEGGSTQFRNLMSQTNVVDHILDENIAASYRKMKATTNGDFWTETVLDDDSKELALHNRDMEYQYGFYNFLNNSSTV